MATLIKVDKNGTKTWYEAGCPKCNGTGFIKWYGHIEGGVCFKCGGTGEGGTTWKEYTPEYAEKLNARRLEKARKNAPEKNARFFASEGMDENGTAWIVLGDTYSIKDELKEHGARYNSLYGWHFDHEVNEYIVVKVTIDQVATIWADGTWQYDDAVEKIEKIKEQATPKSGSEYIAEVGEMVEVEAALKDEILFETHFSFYGEMNAIYKFADKNGNVIVWKTAPKDMEVGKKYKIRGRVKELGEYKGEKQTALTRCRVSEI